MNLTIGIPCLNESATIEHVIRSLPKKLNRVDQITILVIDDGSRDETASIANNCGAIVVSHGINRGLGVAFSTMVNWCLSHKIDILVTVDGDGQFNVDDIPNLIAPILDNKADFVSASRFFDAMLAPDGIPPLKLWGNQRMARIISRLTGQNFSDVACGFRAYSKDCLVNLNLFGKFTYTQETFLDLSFKGFRIVEIPSKVVYFSERQSRVARSLLKYAINTMKIIARVYRDYYPLRFFWALGLINAIIGLSLGTHFVLHYLETNRFYGAIWAGMSSAFTTGLAMFFGVLGLVVDMLDRIRINQERQLALLKKHYFYDGA